MDPIIVVDGAQLWSLIDELTRAPSNKLSVHIDGEHVKFKVNEHMWSPPMGKKLDQ